jgi:hypothetical protein
MITYRIKSSSLYTFRKEMDALKAGVEKVKEAVEGKKADDQHEKANNPSVKPSERMDAEFEANKAATKCVEHHAKAEEYKTKHVNN